MGSCGIFCVHVFEEMGVTVILSASVWWSFGGRSCLSLQNVRRVSSVCMIVRSPLNLRAVPGPAIKARTRAHELKDGTICSPAP